MDKSQKRVKQLIWSALGIQTHLLYLVIVLFLLYGTEEFTNPQSVLEIFIPLVVLSLCLSILTMMKGFNDEKTLKWGIIWLAIFQIPSIVGLVLTFLKIG